MLTLVFVLTAVAAVTAHHFLVVRPRQRRLAGGVSVPFGKPVPLSAAMERLPRGVFLQPTYTWSQIDASGDLMVGVHPMMLGLVGAPYELELRVDGGTVRKGAPLFRIGKGDRCLTLRSPVTGKIVETKGILKGDKWERLAAGVDEWLCRIEPEHVAEEIGAWMIADRALEWTKRQYGEIREHLLRVGAGKELSLTLADGGEVPVGVLAELDGEEWEAFEDAFLHA